ncbi:DNA repair protein RecN [Halosquirtibacter xylanolyticus]|uniref:DNA repair protein RecN n=1 Tax=Halosquirtibacter xylanolyticus TaxID=3374599 RepID=UPI003749F83F|nr:DNA repair protein RecN [Prolixibacteraceae bacterium]
MLKHLSISNYAIISDLSLDLEKGFSIITGETGAGKSIILGALSILMGARTEASVLKNKEKKCIIEAQFDIEAYGLESLFESYDLDWDATTYIRREITPKGKSRAFINDSPASVKILKEISSALIDIHAQNEALKMHEKSFQYEILDASLPNRDLLNNYTSLYHRWGSLTRQLQEKEQAYLKACADFDYYQFQVNQLAEANLQEDEQDSLEQRRDAMEHAESIHAALYQTSQGLNVDEVGVTPRLKEIYQTLQRVADHSKEVKELSDRLESAWYELRDISNEAEALASNYIYNPVELEEINQRLDTIYTLQQKHRVNTIAELLQIESEYADQIGSVSHMEQEIESLKDELHQITDQLTETANLLSEARSNVLGDIESYIQHILLDLGMPNASFKIQLDTTEKFNRWGNNEIEYLLAANKNQILEPIHKVASGGEVSRVMLALKSLLVQKKSLPTMIFDEIDTGISGDIARKMGLLLKEMGTNMQVINITHLPQVAALGDNHFFVYKSDSESETNSHIRKLTLEERLHEVAKMLSGETITDAALKNAKELMNDQIM